MSNSREEYLKQADEFLASTKARGIDLEKEALGVAANLNAIHLLNYIQYEMTMIYLKGYMDAGGDFSNFKKKPTGQLPRGRAP